MTIDKITHQSTQHGSGSPWGWDGSPHLHTQLAQWPSEEEGDLGVIRFIHSPMDIDSAQVTIKDSTMQAVTEHGFMPCQGDNGTHIVTTVTSAVTLGSTPCRGVTNTQFITVVSPTTCHGVTNIQAVNLVTPVGLVALPHIIEPPTCRLSLWSAQPYVTGP